MANALDIDRREICDRLVLLLIAQPREGWEPEFEEITRREIERLAFPGAKGDGDK
jgi:NADPH-dependent 2,4-dienoyl-CoA reductase/sulfur reductase-like enzyme